MAVLNLSKHRFTDSSQKGRWIEPSEGGRVLIARWNNPEFRKLQTQLYQEYRRPRPNGPHIKGNKIPPEIQEEITHILVERTIVLDWADISTDGVTALPCDKKNKEAVLRNEEYRWLFDEIVTAAMDEESYRQEQLEEDVGNSEAA